MCPLRNAPRVCHSLYQEVAEIIYGFFGVVCLGDNCVDWYTSGSHLVGVDNDNIFIYIFEHL